MKPELIAILGVFLFFATAEALRTSFFRKPEQRPKDLAVELIGPAVLMLISQPLIVLGVNFALSAFASPYEGALANLSWPLALLAFVILDDMTQYWWHRSSHKIPWLYNLHRSHHDAPYMGVRVIYRNGIFYYWLMPGLWFSAILVWLGLGWVYVGYIIAKQTIITAAHSDVCWDKKLYDIPALSPLMWVLERTISTPATHHGHHGRDASDPATHYKGNYGNMLFFWDVLFGTAKITRQYPKSYGVEKLQPVGVAQQLLWPLVQKDGPSTMARAKPSETNTNASQTGNR